MKRIIILVAILFSATCLASELTDDVTKGSGATPSSGPSTQLEGLSAFWKEVHLAAGLGLTYRTVVTGKLVPVSATWNDNRWEVFAAHFRDQTIGGLRYQGYPAHEGLAPPMWAATVSRRFNFVDHQKFQSFVGIGAAYLDTNPCPNSATANDHTPVLDYNEYVYHGCDKLNGSKLNYSLQLGMRFYDRDRSHALEFTYRHFSNAGMTSGNRGEDLLTAMLVF